MSKPRLTPLRKLKIEQYPWLTGAILVLLAPLGRAQSIEWGLLPTNPNQIQWSDGIQVGGGDMLLQLGVFCETDGSEYIPVPGAYNDWVANWHPLEQVTYSDNTQIGPFTYAAASGLWNVGSELASGDVGAPNAGIFGKTMYTWAFDVATAQSANVAYEYGPSGPTDAPVTFLPSIPVAGVTEWLLYTGAEVGDDNAPPTDYVGPWTVPNADTGTHNTGAIAGYTIDKQAQGASGDGNDSYQVFYGNLVMSSGSVDGSPTGIITGGDGNTMVQTATFIPEPSTTVMIMLLPFLTLTRRRRQA